MESQTEQKQDSGLEPKGSGPPELSRVLANPWRARILSELYLHPMSAKQFSEEVGGTKTTISRHMQNLVKWGYLELVEQRQGGARRGGIEKIYRAIQRDDLRLADWARLTQEEREEKSGNSITIFFRRVAEAVEAGTFDADISRHWSWDAVTLDDAAWDRVTRRLDEILDWLPDLEAESAQRLKESGEAGIPATIGLSLFRSPTRAQRRSTPLGKTTRS